MLSVIPITYFPPSIHFETVGNPYYYFLFPQIIERIKKYFDILGGPATFIQVCILYACFQMLEYNIVFSSL